MLCVINQTNIAISKEIIDFLGIIKDSLCPNEVELVIVNECEIRRLNKEFLHKDYATDVLSFGLDYSDIKIPSPPLGSIVISIDSAICMAESCKHSLKEEMAILFVHSLLHLLGYDHECDNGEHRLKEIEILAQFGINNPLITRNMNASKNNASKDEE